MTTAEKKETNRNSRDSETHDKQARRQPWRPVRKLETPPPPLRVLPTGGLGQKC